MSAPPLQDRLAELLSTLEATSPGLGAHLWLTEHAEDDREIDNERCRLSAPIRSGQGALLGAILLAPADAEPLRDHERRLVEAIAAAAAAMIDSAQLRRATREYREVLDRVPAAIYIADPGESGQWYYVSPQIEAILGFPAARWRRDAGLWRDRLHPEDRSVVLAMEGVHADEIARAGQKPLESSAVEYRMLHLDGHTVWIRDDARLVSDASGRVRWHGVLSDITERKQVEAELERRAAQQGAVARLGEHALERASIPSLVQEAVDSAFALLGADFAVVGELVPDENRLVALAAAGGTGAHPGGVPVLGGLRSQAGYTLATRESVTVSDWSRETRFEPSQLLSRKGIKSGITVVIDGSEQPFGIFGVHFRAPLEHSAGDVDFVQSLANVLADALARQATEDAISHRALHDPLTSLPNRVLFLDRVALALDRRVREQAPMIAVLFIDLDQFKLVNDSLGHHAGDELLSAVATRLEHTVRPGDTIARFGGDEFGLLLEDLSSERDAISAAERVAAAFTRPFVLSDSEHFVTASIGIAMAKSGDVPAELVRDADSAMYRAKDRGRARYELFDAGMRARAIARLRLENDLRRAVERNQLRLMFQPVVSLADERIVSVEALLRWDHPQRGMIAPDEFIPVAEENGLIDRIGRWVLDTACRQAVAWANSRPDAPPIGVAVNLSPQQLHARGFAEMVARTLRSTGIDAASLSFEITEALLLEESSATNATLLALKALGVRLVLDDFGTGYSSLGYLTRLPLDALKVDRSFVALLDHDASSSAITAAIVAMARALSLEIVGEGTETRQQVEALRAIGAHYAQGFLFSEPVSAEAITAQLMSDAPAPRSRVP